MGRVSSGHHDSLSQSTSIALLSRKIVFLRDQQPSYYELLLPGEEGPALMKLCEVSFFGLCLTNAKSDSILLMRSF